MKDFHVIIPARYKATRLPGKPLLEIHGQTVLERVYRQALKAMPSSCHIATDHELIFSAAQQWGAPVYMTAETHQSGTDRIAEVVAALALDPNAIVVNVQGDEPFIPPALIRQVANLLHSTEAPMATLCWSLENSEQIANPNVVKVVLDSDNRALYFSRAALAASYRHIGIYAYRAGFLLDLVKIPVCALEKAESLEQLRVLWSGFSIQVAIAEERPLQDINTEQDYLNAIQIYS